MDVTPAPNFYETTGSRLARDGVDGAQKLLESAVKSGGGTIFIDEAYQLTSGHNSQGGAVLDFLLVGRNGKQRWYIGLHASGV